MSASAHSSAAMSKKTLLIIDDDDDIREVAQLTLELGALWRVLAASSGRVGVELAKASSSLLDAILLDVMMPGLDGPATLELLRQQDQTRDIPVIFLTAKTRPTERARLTALGVAGVLAKPFDPLALPEQIATLLGWTL
jgi:two-component system alkaline phosphatase synthesis response regulator PhoP